MTEMMELTGSGFKAFVISLPNKLKEIKENMTIMKREMEDIKKTQARLLWLKM